MTNEEFGVYSLGSSESLENFEEEGDMIKQLDGRIITTICEAHTICQSLCFFICVK